MLTLYHSPGSSSLATHIALNEIGVPFELKLTALGRKENRAPDYLAINPEGKVPTLMLATAVVIAGRGRVLAAPVDANQGPGPRT